MGKTVLLLALLTTALITAGCSEPDVQQDKAQEGMSKKEEEKLNQRIAELEEKVDEQSDEQPKAEEATQEDEGAEDAVLAAARDYYAAAAGGNYSYTYDNLSSESRGQFTEDEWVTDNTALRGDLGTYSINSVEMVDDTTAEVQLTITAADGTSSERTTLFVLEDGSWLHELTASEYELFASATDASTAAASDSSTASAMATADGETKHVAIVVTSDKPADVSISDDSLDWFITEEIVGTKTYERDIAANSGLSVSATTGAYQAQTTVEVYEDGQLVAQDSDSTGFALVNY
jgi:hypothetical protein